MPILSNLIVRIGASTNDFDKQVNASLNKVKRFASDVTAAGTALSIGFSAPLIAAGAAAIKAGSDMESLTMGLKAVMKSSEATAAEMAKLREVAKLPGLGLEEAVKGTIRLQILGNSADQSRRIMGELGNALAVVGGGREDFNEVIRQLSQLGAVGKVTKENLDPIIERIPQLAAIIKEKFGAEALGDPAKTFEKLGLSSQQFIQIITDELAKGERAGNTYKNSWENIQMAAKDAAAEFGKTLLPIAQRVLDDFLTPGIEKAKALATAFRDLPQPTQDWALGLTAVATAAPLVVAVLGTLAEKAAILAGVLNKAGITGATFGAALGTLALGLKSVDEALLIYEKLKETGYQFERLTGACSDAKKNVEFFRGVVVDLASKFPDLSGNIKRAYDAIRALSDATMLPGFGLFKAALDAINAATAAATGRSKEMDSAIANLTKRTIEQGSQNIKLVSDMKNFGGASEEAAGKAKDHAKTLGDLSKATNKIIVDSIAGRTAIMDFSKGFGEVISSSISKTSLVYVEGLERIKAGVGRAKDAVFDFIHAGDGLGKKLETSSTAFDYLARRTDDYATSLKRVIAEQEKLVANDNVRNMGTAAPLGFPKLPTTWGAKDAARDMGIETEESRAKRIANLQRNADILREANRRGDPNVSGNMVIEAEQKLKKAIDDTGNAATKAGKAQTKAMQQVSLVVNDLAKGITDVIFKGGKLGDMFKNVALQSAQSITRLLIEGALTKLTDKLLDVGTTMATVFGGGTGVIKSAAPSAGGGLSGMMGTGSGGGASAASSAGGLMGAANVITGAITAVSSVIGNFQMMGMNKTLDLIEHEVRYSQIHLLHILEKGNEFWPYMKSVWESLIRMEQRQMAVGAGGGASVVINLNGGDPKAALEEITRTLKQFGVIPRG